MFQSFRFLVFFQFFQTCIEDSVLIFFEEFLLTFFLGSLSFTDWDWVRKRLASRETILERPNSCLTFSNFLETLSLDSDEYDTDLEDDFPLPNLSSNDRTGLHKYKQICVNKGTVLFRIFNQCSQRALMFLCYLIVGIFCCFNDNIEKQIYFFEFVAF